MNDQIREILTLLAQTTAHFSAAAGLLGDDRLTRRPDPRTWSLNDNLAHIRDCADVWGKTIEQMLAADEPELPHIHPRDYTREVRYYKVPFRISFDAFASQRDKLLDILRDLPLESWERGALIKGRRHTVFSQARRMALHEQRHCEQVEVLIDEF